MPTAPARTSGQEPLSNGVQRRCDASVAAVVDIPSATVGAVQTMLRNGSPATLPIIPSEFAS